MMPSLARLAGLMRAYGVRRIFAKKLASNDNSKNQIYLGGDFSALNIIPHGKIYIDSAKTGGSVRDRAKADVDFSWLDAAGKHNAPSVQLILYPKYPEVRMSGFIKGCQYAPSGMLNTRDEGRVLFLGVTGEGEVLGYLAPSGSPVTTELDSKAGCREIGVFLEIPIDSGVVLDTTEPLLVALKKIYQKHWISSKKLNSKGIAKPYRAGNGGGYTLEAELGVSPNSYAAPDFLGWEIKQYGVSNFSTYRPKSPVTLMTPEPTEGVYIEAGIPAFLRKFGYADVRGRPDRINFGGVYSTEKGFHERTRLRLELNGFDAGAGKITDMSGSIQLVTNVGEVAALWRFADILSHWNRKHALAAYIPSLFRSPPPEYAYGPRVLLCQQTDFLLFLKAMAAGVIYYDPAIKMEAASTRRPSIKRRSQFRAKHSQLKTLYHHHQVHDLGNIR